MKFGYIPDRADPRDERFSFRNAFGNTSPDSKQDLWFSGMEIRDQGATNSCTGFSTSYALRMAYKASGKPDPGDFSAYDLYWKARALDKLTGFDDGAQLRSVFKALQVAGCAKESVWPSARASNVNLSPTWAAQRSAHDFGGLRGYHRIVSYSVEDTVRQAQEALSARKPIIGGWLIGPSFVSYSNGVYSPIKNEKTLGGHALCISGFDGDTFLGVNSWGIGWGDLGKFHADSEFLFRAIALWVVDIRGSR